jgi:hypothetical protein
MSELSMASGQPPDAVDDTEAPTQASVLITEHEVRLSTAAVVRPKPARTTTSAPRHYPRREPGYFERARMAREMDRL